MDYIPASKQKEQRQNKWGMQTQLEQDNALAWAGMERKSLVNEERWSIQVD